jgi:DNA-binding beta-propeller fold protein YncE
MARFPALFLKGAVMSGSRYTKFTLLAAVVAVAAVGGWRLHAQAPAAAAAGGQGRGGPPAVECKECGTPVNDPPNPYQTIPTFVKLPSGRKMGSTSAIDIDKDGKTIWVAERCGANSCIEDPATGRMSTVDPVLHVDENGNIIKMFGAGMLVAPHGIYVDKDGNIWITDYQANAPAPGRGAGGGRGAAGAGGAAAGAAAGGAAAGQAPAGRGRAALGNAPGATVGMQVIKFSPKGDVLMKLGQVGGATPPECCYAPNDVLVAPNGDIFIGEGHGQGPDLVLKLDKTGKLIKSWGGAGTGPGQFDQPHSLAMDSKGLLYVADRNNNRVQVFDQDGKFIRQYYQFGRPSGVFIDKKDNLYVADSESQAVSRNHLGWKNGMRMGSLKDGKVVAFIPDPANPPMGTSAAEGVAVDSKGNIYGAEVGPKDVKKYVKK